ncbi:MAG: polysaccharide deacetylase family protein [Longimicrobiales bacterium]
MRSRWFLALYCALLSGACSNEKGGTNADSSVRPIARASAQSADTVSTPAPTPSTEPARAPNELGRVMVLEYHLVGANEARWERQRDRFRKDLELLYQRGYRPISASELVDRKIDLPAGLSPVVITFDDASPSQFRFLERNGQLEIDPTSAVGIWLDFATQHSDWRNKAVFCLLSGAEAGRSFFGNKDIEGQKTEWRHRKVKFLAEQGFELCNHTLWHAQLSKYDDAFVQEQIARLQMAVDSAVPGYRIRVLALPLGLWPKNRELARKGAWTDPKSGRTISYQHDAVLEVAGGPTRGPHDPNFDAYSLDRLQVTGSDLEKAMDYLEKTGTGYVSDGNPAVVARGNATPTTTPAKPGSPRH